MLFLNVVVSPDGKCTAAVMLNIRPWAKGFDFARGLCRIASQAN
jgi:hypothetical protein